MLHVLSFFFKGAQSSTALLCKRYYKQNNIELKWINMWSLKTVLNFIKIVWLPSEPVRIKKWNATTQLRQKEKYLEYEIEYVYEVITIIQLQYVTTSYEIRTVYIFNWINLSLPQLHINYYFS